MVETRLPQPVHSLPEKKTEFKDAGEKGAYIQEVLGVSTKAMTLADEKFAQFLYPQAQAEYLVCLEGFMQMLRLTTDDPKFQAYLKQRLHYLLDRGEKCKQAITGKFKDKKVAGYHTAEDSPAFQNALAHVLQERHGSHQDEKTKKDVEQLIKNIRERGSEAEDKPADIPDAATGKIDGAGEKKEEEKKDSDSKLTSNLDPAVVKSINETILDSSPNVQWDDVKGLVEVKKILQETIVLPIVRPDIFKGLLSPSKGILLYGPPGNGKTMLAKAIATECKSTFFNVSASTLTSKWMGEGEKLMKCLFALAADNAPSVIFIDEIDSIMGARGGNEHEASRRLKTEFLIQFDGVNSASEKNILVLAATNRPQDLDEAALRRLTRRIFMPLPDAEARQALIEYKLKSGAKYEIGAEDMAKLMDLSEGYSCADLNFIVKEAAMTPIREMATEDLMKMKDTDALRPIVLDDFQKVLLANQPSVSKATIEEFDEWRKQKGQ